MRPRFYPSLVNGRFGDPSVYVKLLMEKRAMLFDLGDISRLPPRAILHLSDVFVSHAHIDHFIGFDRLLRLCVGRRKQIRLYGPAGFIDRVEAKLNAYTWNLASRFRDDLVFTVTELNAIGEGRRAQFRLTARFVREAERPVAIHDRVALSDPSLSVTFAVLEHRTPCLAFALQEPRHLNIWRNRLDDLKLTPGPWLRDLKRAIHDGLPDATQIRVRQAGSTEQTVPLGTLRDEVVSITPGQKIAYVTDAAPTEANARAIVDLARGADILFIEAVFADVDEALAHERAHLTAKQAGTLARLANVRRVQPFHFSARYEGEEFRLVREVDDAFHNGSVDTPPVFHKDIAR